MPLSFEEENSASKNVDGSEELLIDEFPNRSYLNSSPQVMPEILCLLFKFSPSSVNLTLAELGALLSVTERLHQVVDIRG